MQSGESRGAEHTFLAWTGDGAAPATKRLTLLTSRGLHRLPTLCVFTTDDACDPKTKPITDIARSHDLLPRVINS